MSNITMVLYGEEYQIIKTILVKLYEESNAKMVFLLDKNGQQIASHGELDGIDVVSLASLTAGNVAATDCLAQLIGEKEFPVLVHEGEKNSIHIAVVAQCVILVVIFDNRSSLGLVRLRIKRASRDLAETFQSFIQRTQQKQEENSSLNSLFAEITDEDLDNLFRNS